MNARPGYTIVLLLAGVLCWAQNSSREKIFPAPVSKIQAALKNLPGGTAGALPLLDGFVLPGTRKLDAYQRPYYQCSVHITPATSGGSLVRVVAKITAWDSDPKHSGYEVLQSNGRLESDLLDRLQERLADNSNSELAKSASSSTPSNAGTPHAPASPAPDISAPMPQFRGASGMGLSPAGEGKGTQDPALQQEAQGLEDLVRNQSHPTDLIAVKENQTPVLQDPSADAKVLFLASAEDEFEVLDKNPEWVHVRISGLSRGWLRRTGVEMLDGSENANGLTAPSSAPASPSKPSLSSSLFSISSEEDGSFPGDWAPLKGKSVKIVSIQQATGTGRITSPQDKMRFAEGLFKSESTEKSSAGLVLIFDAEDGGMVAATQAVLDKWKNGSLTEQALWKQCYLDPPEILGTVD